MNRPDDLNGFDRERAKQTISGVLSAWRPTRSQIDRRLRRQLVEAWQHLNRDGDPYDLVEPTRRDG